MFTSVAMSNKADAPRAPPNPEHAPLSGDDDRQSEGGPVQEQFVDIRAGLVGLAEQGKQRADDHERNQQRVSTRGVRRWPPERQHKGGEKQCFEKHEATDDAKLAPIRGDEEHDARRE
jgi:hypothetical protein